MGIGLHGRPGGGGLPSLVVVHSPRRQQIGAKLLLTPGEVLPVGRNRPPFGAAPLEEAVLQETHVLLNCELRRLHVHSASATARFGYDGAETEHASMDLGEFIQLGRVFLQFSAEAAAPPDALPAEFLGLGDAFTALRSRLAAAGDQATLLLSPPGAGANTVARELHRRARRSGPLVCVECRERTESSLEIELFGYHKGAVPGAPGERVGAIEKAHEGTLVVVGVEALPIEVQQRLVRSLRSGRARRTGAVSEREVDVRPVFIAEANGEAEAHPALAAELRDYCFAITVPQLRARRIDVPLIAHSILHRSGHPDIELGADLMWAVLRNPWPTNFRGLEQFLKLSVPLARDGVLGLSAPARAFLDEQLVIAESQPTIPAPKRTSVGPPVSAPARPSRDALVRLLDEHKGRVARVAEALRVPRQQVQLWAEHYAIDAEKFRL